jgi:hypothetical protein
MDDEITARVRGSMSPPWSGSSIAPEADLGGEVNRPKPPRGDYIGTVA